MQQQIVRKSPSENPAHVSVFRRTALLAMAFLCLASLPLWGSISESLFSREMDAPLHLNINTDSTINASICAGNFYEFNGDTLFNAGQYSATFTGSVGSDSTVFLNLSVLEPAFTELEASICDGDSVEFDGQAIFSEGNYSATYTAANGCDSVVSLTVTVLPGTYTALEATLCPGDSVEFDGLIIYDAGDYLATYAAANGCDSLVSLVVTVLPENISEVEATICEGDSIEFEGQVLYEAGDYLATYTGENGCDSVIALVLTVIPTTLTHFEYTFCDSVEFDFFGTTLTESGTYEYLLTSVETGCDSIVSVTLNFVDHFDTQLSTNLCDGDTLVFGGQEIVSAGIFTDTLTAFGGCDSILHLTVNILEIPNSTTAVSICEGSGYLFNGQIFDQAGSFDVVLENAAANGCDSVATLQLSTVQLFETPLAATICSDETYAFGGATYSQSGIYTDTLTAVGGCDSVLVLTLTVLPTSNSETSATICSNEDYAFNGTIYSQSGTYAATLTGANGCDSVATLVLTVLPTSSSESSLTLCYGEEVAFGGTTLSLSGTYTTNYDAANGCDSVVTLNLTVLPEIVTATNGLICPGESVDFAGEQISMPGFYADTLTAANGCDSIVTFVLTFLPTSNSETSATICAGEEIHFNNANYSQSGTYTATLTGVNGCDSVATLVLTVLPNASSETSATICSNETFAFNGTTYAQSGTYTATLTAANGCDSVATLILNVLPASGSTIEASICANESYPFFGATYSQSGTYTGTLTGANGCDSVVALNLTVLPIEITGISLALCEGETFDFNGQTISQAGNYTAVLTAANGCDSIVNLTLVYLNSPKTNLHAEICASTSIEFNGTILTESGVYEAVLTAESGCDSIVTMTLFVGSPLFSETSVTICEGETYEFNGQFLTETDIYNDTLLAVGGCDSIATLSLTVLPTFSSSLEITICDGESYDFDGQNLTASGNYVGVFAAANGCDSTVALNLVVLPTAKTEISETICAGEGIAFNGQFLTETGTYTSVLQAENGCDSTVILTLNVLPLASSVTEMTICSGEEIEFNGTTYSESGTYEAILAGANGCDSLAFLVLNVLPKAETELSAKICQGEVYEFDGQELEVSGIYTAVLAASNGCDSVVTLSLTVNPIYMFNEMVSVCEGDSVVFEGQAYGSSGIFTASHTSVSGCDSVHVLTLTVFPVYNNVSEVTICGGDSYFFNGQPVNQAGTYTANLQTANGCDSTETLILSVFEVNASVSVSGKTITANAQNALYQWINCDTNQPIAGATGQSFTPTVSGNYAVQVTQSGCSEVSICTFVEVISTLEPENAIAWSILPNPTSGEVNLKIEDANGQHLRLEIFDASGRLLLQRNLQNSGAEILDLSELPHGLLLVKLTDGRRVSVKRLVKQ